MYDQESPWGIIHLSLFSSDVSLFSYNQSVKTVLSYPEVIPADLRMNDDYVFYYNNLAKLLITGIIPFVSLCFFNFKIYSALKKRRQVMGPAATAAHQNQLNEDNGQSLVLFSIVVIFLVTNSPRIIMNIDEVNMIKLDWFGSHDFFLLLKLSFYSTKKVFYSKNI